MSDPRSAKSGSVSSESQGVPLANKSIFDLSGKTAIVIGGGSGIGEAVALGAARSGARVTCLDINEAAAKSVGDRARAEQCACEAGVLDIRDSAAVTRTFDEVRDRHGSLDIVICTPSINVRKKILDCNRRPRRDAE